MSPAPRDAKAGLVAGGRGGPDDQLLEDGQEEVFAREEVESGRIEHHVDAGGRSSAGGSDALPKASEESRLKPVG